MKIVIDHERCTGHGRCYVLAGELVEDDDEGYGRVKDPGTFGSEQQDVARKAVLACPERAVSIEDSRSDIDP